MIWEVSGAGLVLYELWAIMTGRTRVSRAAHQWPWAILIWAWVVTFILHLVGEWLREIDEGWTYP